MDKNAARKACPVRPDSECVIEMFFFWRRKKCQMGPCPPLLTSAPKGGHPTYVNQPFPRKLLPGSCELFYILESCFQKSKSDYHEPFHRVWTMKTTTWFNLAIPAETTT